MVKHANRPNLLRSLQYFEAVARHRSLKLASDDLGVTQSAVSHQLRRFSDSIGRQLVVKAGRGIALTETGQNLARRLTGAFADLEDLVHDLKGSDQTPLQLAVCTSFAPGWLVQRLEEFYRAHPKTRLELRLYAQDPLLTNEVADAYVIADDVKPGYTTIPLLEEMLIAVEAPRDREPKGSRSKRALISTDVERGKEGKDWIEYCETTGMKRDEMQDGPFRLCTHFFLALEMARAGHGVALVPDFLAARDLKAGTLVPFNDRLVPSGRTYKLCFKDTRAQEPKLRLIADWLSSESARNPYRLNSGRGRSAPPPPAVLKSHVSPGVKKP
jgi:LysR family transcriptional regulator, glycine cleavage system transcriptional activator